ncbi:MAG: sulfite exporter TauE/SafE family protein [Phycisphaerales bacterium]
MTPLLVSVFLASVLGSMHCAGMCGAFVMLAVSDFKGRPANPGAALAAYHLGRLTTYTLLGSIAGIVGEAIDLGGANAGISRAASVGASILLAATGLFMLARAAGLRVRGPRVPARWQRVIERGYHAAFGLPPVLRAGGIGLLTTLLPCGWLYSFVIAAAGTGDPISGALVMIAFWGGTLPVLSLAGVSGRRVTNWLGARAPLATALLLILMGAGTAIARFSTPLPAAPNSAAHVSPFCGAAPDLAAADRSPGGSR